jgi:hypothetical protein
MMFEDVCLFFCFVISLPTSTKMNFRRKYNKIFYLHMFLAHILRSFPHFAQLRNLKYIYNSLISTTNPLNFVGLSSLFIAKIKSAEKRASKEMTRTKRCFRAFFVF